MAANPEQATNLHNNNNHHLRQDPSLTSPTNDTKQQQQAYTPATFTNLISRYEEPSASARWDSPLFTLPHSDSNPAYEAIATALFPTPSNQPKKNPTPETKTQPQVQAQPSSTPIKAHLSTAPPTHQSSNALYTLERETTSITTAIQNYISTAGIEDCAGEIILLPAITFTSTSTSTSISGTDKPHQNSESESESELQIRLPNSGHLTVAQLQRLKRQFVSLYRSRGVGITIGSGGVGAAVGEMDVEGFRRGFVGFLNASFDGAG